MNYTHTAQKKEQFTYRITTQKQLQQKSQYSRIPWKEDKSIEKDNRIPWKLIPAMKPKEQKFIEKYTDPFVVRDQYPPKKNNTRL